MQKHKVTFLPDNITTMVEDDTTILKAAEQANVFINNLCGGEGICGECRVQIVRGNAHPDRHSIEFLTVEDIKKGFVLACYTRIHEDLAVSIPVKSRTGKDKIVLSGSPVVYSKPEKVFQQTGDESISSFDPVVSKIYLELPEPTLNDNISDIDRLTRALQKMTHLQKHDVPLPVLRNLARVVRESDWKITVTVAKHHKTGRILKIEHSDTANKNFGLAVDVGTTTVVAQLVHVPDMKIVGTEGSHNLQARYGEDVISRMVYACNQGNMDSVHQSVIKNINELLHTLLTEHNIKAEDVNAVVAAGNTTMSHFLLNLPPCAIRIEPYVPTASVYPQIHAEDLGINIAKQGIMEVLPSVAAYLGGDIVAGVLACGIADRPEVRCLIDIGTNGEIVIGNNEWLVCCSASAGPAFEGAGARYGMRATSGAIEKIEIRNGKIILSTIDNVKPRGICGSGLIDIIYEFVRNGIIDQNGRFDMSRQDRRLIAEEGDPRYIIAVAEDTDGGQAITVSESEIANLIKSKGSVFAAIKSLVDYVGLTFDQLTDIYVAGGFGSSINISKAIGIGLLPDVDTEKIQFIGNSSLTGARMSMLSTQALEKTRKIASRMTNVELSTYPPFMNEFIAALFLPHTDSKLFPSVSYKK